MQKRKLGCDSGLIIPDCFTKRATPSVTKSVPFTKAYSPVGVKGSAYNFKLTQLQKDVVTTKEYEAAKKNGKKKLLRQIKSPGRTC